jgi:hypothetical protein
MVMSFHSVGMIREVQRAHVSESWNAEGLYFAQERFCRLDKNQMLMRQARGCAEDIAGY